jgi:hypothetical protein
MFDFFKPKELQENYFLSYRNIPSQGKYPNYELAGKLVNYLVQNIKCDGCTTIPPEAIPPGTLFTPYDVARFLHLTFLYLDGVDHFIILDKDYFSNGQTTSIWTHAEYLMWSYYDRDMFLGSHRRKDKFYTVATPDPRDSSIFHLSQQPLLALDEFTRYLLRRASTDFNSPGSHTPYSKFAHQYLFLCNSCGTGNLIAKKTIQKIIKENGTARCCECHTSFTLSKSGEYFVAGQTQPRTGNVQSDITFILELMVENKSPFPVIND